MVTIKDIALKAGVSHGTVSNVLNKKGNVSAEKITLVENAAKALGYKMNVQAKQLRQGSVKRVSLLVPRIDMKCYRDMFEALNNVLSEMDYEVDIHYTNNLPHNEEKLLEKISSSNPSTIIVVSTFPENTGIFSQATRMIFVDRKVGGLPENILFAAFDFELAGREIALRCLKDGKKKIAIFCGNCKYSNYKAFVRGAEETLSEGKCRYRVFSADEMVGINTAFNIAFSEQEFDAVITSEMEYVEYLKRAYQYTVNGKMPSVYSVASKEMPGRSTVIRYELNYKLFGRKMAKLILEMDEGGEFPEEDLIMHNDGFGYPLQVRNSTCKESSLTLLILKSPIGDALRFLIPDFTRKTGIKVKLVEDEYWGLYASVQDSANSAAYDLVRMDMLWLTEMAEKVLMPLEIQNSMVSEILDGISPKMPDEYFRVNDILYSLPFDPSVQILYYRKELFEDALVKREFYEKYRRQLKVPENYAEYREVAEFFTRRYNPDSPTEYGHSMVFGSAITAACDFLPRVRAENVRIEEDGRIRINTPEVKRILQEYIDARAYAKSAVNMWWKESVRDFAYGKAAMITVFSNYASLMMNEIDSQIIGKIGIASVPGGSPLLGGGVIGISKNSKKREESLTFLRWLYDQETALMITQLGGYINRKDLLEHVDLLNLYPWLEGMDKAFAKGERNITIHSSGFDEYKFEEVLGYAIRAAATEILSVEEAIEEAQRKCDIMF